MLATNQYIKQWKQWINRDKKYAPDELEELETFLLDKIEDLQETQKLSDKEAFLQALDIMGEQGLLTEEFSKVRRSKFDKVRLWAYGQTFLILGLVMVIAGPYVHLPNKDPSDSLISIQIGEMDERVKNTPIFRGNSYVTYQKETYFYDEFMNTLYCFKQYSPDFAFYLSYKLDAQKFDEKIFDFDSQKNLYKKQYLDGNIDIFKNQQLIKTISYLDKIEPDSHTEAIKVIDRNLVVLVRQERRVYYEFEDLDGKETQTSYSSTGKDASYLLVCNLDTNQWDRIDLANIALSMDRSMDELAILLNSGEIVIFSKQNGKLILKENWKIKDFSLYIKKNQTPFLTKLTEPLYIIDPSSKLKKVKKNLLSIIKVFFMSNRKFDNSMSLLYSKKGHQAILIDYQNTRYSFLSPNLKKEYKAIPLIDKDIEGVIKVNFGNEERLALVKDDSLGYDSGVFNMYLFKDYSSVFKVFLKDK